MMASHAPRTGQQYLIVGTGSVGLSIVEALSARGETKIRGFDAATPTRRPVASNFEFVQGDVTDYEAIRKACEGVDVVYATFAAIRYMERMAWQYEVSHKVNVVGTQNLLRACTSCNVAVVVQTSTSNVCVAKSIVGFEMDETSAMVGPHDSPNHYGWSKVQSERAVLAANNTLGPDATRPLRTGCVRPCSAIFGPEDRFITQRFNDEAKATIFVGWPTIDYVFVENVVWGHLLLERAILDRPESAAGETYCVSNGEPCVANDFYRALAHWHERVTGAKMTITRLPLLPMVGLCYAVELFERVTRSRVKGDLANMTPAMLATAELSYTFSHAKAGRLLGYKPLYTLDEALHRTVLQWREMKRSPRPFSE